MGYLPPTKGDLIMQVTSVFKSKGSNALSSLFLWFSVLLISLATLPHLIPYYFQLKYWWNKDSWFSQKDRSAYVTYRTLKKRYCAYNNYVAEATKKNVQLVKRWAAVWLKPRNGDLSIFRRRQMSLTYRGLKYNQHKAVVEKQHVQLTYRGKSYQS